MLSKKAVHAGMAIVLAALLTIVLAGLLTAQNKGETVSVGSSDLGGVVTSAGYSDWSTQDVPGSLREIWLRLERTGADYLVESSTDGTNWSQLRLAHLHADDGQQSVAAGLYACSPKAAGYVAEFARLTLTQ